MKKVVEAFKKHQKNSNENEELEVSPHYSTRTATSPPPGTLAAVKKHRKIHSTPITKLDLSLSEHSKGESSFSTDPEVSFKPIKKLNFQSSDTEDETSSESSELLQDGQLCWDDSGHTGAMDQPKDIEAQPGLMLNKDQPPPASSPTATGSTNTLELLMQSMLAKLDKQEERSKRTDEKMDAQSEKMDSQKEELMERMDKQNEKMDKQNEKMDRQDEKMDKQSKDLQDLTMKVDRQSEYCKQVNRELREELVARIDQQAKDNQETTEQLKESQERLQTEIKSCQEKLRYEITENQDRLKADLTRQLSEQREDCKRVSQETAERNRKSMFEMTNQIKTVKTDLHSQWQEFQTNTQTQQKKFAEEVHEQIQDQRRSVSQVKTFTEEIQGQMKDQGKRFAEVKTFTEGIHGLVQEQGKQLQKLQERADKLEKGVPAKQSSDQPGKQTPSPDNASTAPSSLVILDPLPLTPAPTNSPGTAVAAISQQVVRRPYLDGTRLDAFHGREDENLQLWLKKFYLHLKRCQINENTEPAVWELVAHLKGPAESWYYSLPNDVAGSLQSMKEALLKRYGAYDRKWKLWQEMDSIKQITSLSFERYIEDVNNLCHRVGADEETKLRCFVRGLEPKLRIAVASREPTTYQEAERAARLHVALQKGEETSTSEGGFSLKEIGENIGREILKNIQPQPVAAYYGNHHSEIPHSLQPLGYHAGRNQNQGRREFPSQRAPPWYHEDMPNPSQAPVQPYPHDVYQPPMQPERNRQWQQDGRDGGQPPHKALQNITRQLSEAVKVFTQLNAPPQAPVARNRRTTDGRPICDSCNRPGHWARNCNKRNQQASSNQGGRSGRVAAIADSSEDADESVACIKGEVDATTDQPTVIQNVENSEGKEKEIVEEPMCAVDHISVTPDLFVEGTIGSRTVQLLVDTGAKISVMDHGFLTQLPYEYKKLLTGENNRAVKTVSGQRLQIMGVIQLPITIQGHSYDVTMNVLEKVEFDIVLGRDFLATNKAVIDMANHTLQLAPEMSEWKPHTGAIRARETTVIPPHSEVLIPAKLIEQLGREITGVIEGHSRLVERYQLHGAVAMVTVTPGGETMFRLMNPTNAPKTIYLETTLGEFTEVLSEGQPEALSENHCEDTETGKETKLSDLPVPLDLKDVHLDADQAQKLHEFLQIYRKAFALSPSEMGRTDIIRHHINTGDHPPIRLRPYRAADRQKEEIDKQVKDMYDRGIIQPSVSPWAAPVVLVQKPDKTYRFCVDYRKLNQASKKDAYPLPRIEQALTSLSGAKYFTTLDLISGYWQVSMSPDSMEKTAFVTSNGLWEFKVMPFGLCNVPSTFQRLMEHVLRGLNWEICLIYLDDVIVFSRTFEEHLQHLAKVLDRFLEAGIRLKPSKCHFARKTVKYLGHVVSSTGITPDSDKIAAVRDYPTPQSTKDVRGFLGLSGYYRRFVKDFAKIARPLNHLTSKNVKFYWDTSHETAFSQLKQALIEAPILSYPDFNEPFHLYVDASNEAIGMVLGQKQDGREVVIAYGGRALNSAEKNYSVTDRECLAVIAGIKHFRSYIYGRHFKVHTDHHALKYLMQLREPVGRLARWALYLEAYDFEILHRAGTSHGNADALSRRPYPAVIASLDTPGLQTEQVKRFQRADTDLCDLIEYLEKDVLPESKATLRVIDEYCLDEDGLLFHLWTPRRSTTRRQLVVPAALKHEVLLFGHDDVTGGHLGVFKTYEKIRERYYWRKMYADIEHWVTSCMSCAMKKNPRHRTQGPLLPLVVEGAFDKVAVDVLGPMPKCKGSGNKYIVVFSDYLTRWPEAFSVESADAVTIAKLLYEQIISRHGAPRTLLSDRGANFLSTLVKEVCRLVNTEKVNTTAYHPQTDGLVERFNGTLAQSLSMYVNDQQSDWDLQLQTVLFAYRVSPSEVTGESPFYLLYGREPRLPMDVSLLPPVNLSASVAEHRERIVQSIEQVHEIARENIRRAQQKMKAYYDRNTGNPQFRVGDKVWVYTPHVKQGLSRKLAHQYHGPYRRVKQLSPVHFVLRTPDNSRMSTSVHVNRMKRYIDPDSRPIGVPPVDVPNEPYLKEHEIPDDSFEPETNQEVAEAEKPLPSNEPEDNGEEEDDSSEENIIDNETIFRAEKIVGKRKRKGVTQYLIKWKNYSESENSWEPEENIFDYSLIAEYEERKKAEQDKSSVSAGINCFTEVDLSNVESHIITIRSGKMGVIGFSSLFGFIFACVTVITTSQP